MASPREPSPEQNGSEFAHPFDTSLLIPHLLVRITTSGAPLRCPLERIRVAEKKGADESRCAPALGAVAHTRAVLLVPPCGHSTIDFTPEPEAPWKLLSSVPPNPPPP